MITTTLRGLSKQSVWKAFEEAQNKAYEVDWANGYQSHHTISVELLQPIWRDLFNYIDDLESYVITHSVKCNKDLEKEEFRFCEKRRWEERMTRK